MLLTVFHQLSKQSSETFQVTLPTLYCLPHFMGHLFVVQTCPHPSPSTPPPGCHLQHRLPFLVLGQVEIEESGETHTEGVAPGRRVRTARRTGLGVVRAPEHWFWDEHFGSFAQGPTGMNVSIWSPVTGWRSLEGPWLTLSWAWFYFREGGGGEGVVLPPGTGRELSEARGFSSCW